jgi:aspartokinase-like uncharacterized kinase
VGGGLMAHPKHLGASLDAIAAAAEDTPLLVVPGGGAFADVIRDADRRFGLSDDAAHWMAVLAMDQYGHLLASRMTNARLVVRLSDATASLEDGRTPVLAPYQWLREADPLPHSWDVTSDSIAAWVAGQIGAERLLCVKPPGAAGPAIVDPCFDRFLPTHVKAEIVTADRIEELSAMLVRRV